MQRLILVLQYPSKMRYQEWWWEEFPKQLSNYFEVIVLGKHYAYVSGMYDVGEFAPLDLAIHLETEQVKEYLNLVLLPTDVLLLCDLSYPGIFANVLFHKRPSKCFTICHATSKNRLDYFAPIRHAKYPVEKGIAKLFDAVIVGSNYHKDKLGWDNVITLPLPYPTCQTNYHRIKRGVVTVSKRSKQKVTRSLENYAIKCGIVINHIEAYNWETYYKLLSNFKVMLITSKEETFGYQVVDGVLTGCIVIAPDKFSYPELLPKKYLYKNEKEMIQLINRAMQGKLSIPKKLKTDKESKSFFKKLIELFKK